MAAATPTSYTDKIVKSDEVAEFSPEIIDEMKMHVAKYPADRTRSALIPLLMLVQRERGWIDNPGVNFLAKFLKIEVTDIWETATFYSMFNLRPVGRHHIQICKTLVVQDHGRAGHHGSHLLEARHSSRRDDRGRKIYRHDGRMSRKLRHRSDDADRV